MSLTSESDLRNPRGRMNKIPGYAGYAGCSKDKICGICGNLLVLIERGVITVGLKSWAIEFYDYAAILSILFLPVHIVTIFPKKSK